MRTRALNKLAAKTVKSASDGMHSDGGGLFLRVKGGSRSWIFRYTRDKKKREMGLGSASAISLAKARDKAAAARGVLADDGDPITEKHEGPSASAVATTPTFEAAMRRYLMTHRPTWKSAKHGLNWSRSLESHAQSIMHIPVDQIEVKHIEAALLPIWVSSNITAVKIRGRIERVLGGCIARREMPGPNPAAMRDNLEHILPKVKTKVVHHPAVPVERAPEIYNTIKNATWMGSAPLLFTAMTGLRTGEVRTLQWSDLHEDRIAIPSERMKAGRDHTIPVSPFLAQWLADLPRWGDSELIFPGRSGGMMSETTMGWCQTNANQSL